MWRNSKWVRPFPDKVYFGRFVMPFFTTDLTNAVPIGWVLNARRRRRTSKAVAPPNHQPTGSHILELADVMKLHSVATTIKERLLDLEPGVMCHEYSVSSTSKFRYVIVRLTAWTESELKVRAANETIP